MRKPYSAENISEERMKSILTKNSCCEVEMTGLNADGCGIGTLRGLPVIVAGGLPGETLEIKAIKVTAEYVVGKLLKIRRASPERARPFCPAFDRCGGCRLQHLRYDAQLAWKTGQLREELARAGGFAQTMLRETLGMAQPRHFRNKAIYPVGMGKGGAALGFYAAHSHEMIEHDACPAQFDEINRIRRVVNAWILAHDISVYDERRHAGLLRHVLIRVGAASGEAMVVVVVNGADLPRRDALIDALTAAIPRVTSIMLNENRAVTNVILGENTTLMYGAPQIRDRLGGATFAISPRSFYQVNPAQTETLYAKALEYAELTGKETVFDLYSGIGALAICMSPRARQVYGVEIVEDAVRDAIDNARLNGCKQIEFLPGATEAVLPDLTAQGLRADVVALDPPRKGCDPAALDALVGMSPQRIVYISCNPSSMLRDLKFLAARGFATVEIQPVDMFPHTPHVECVAKIVKANSPQASLMS